MGCGGVAGYFQVTIQAENNAHQMLGELLCKGLEAGGGVQARCNHHMAPVWGGVSAPECCVRNIRPGIEKILPLLLLAVVLKSREWGWVQERGWCNSSKAYTYQFGKR